MNRTKIEWVKNPDGTQGYTWNPITGCLNGCEYCYARKLANGRLKPLYLANVNGLPKDKGILGGSYPTRDPFYPRFWPERLAELQRGIDDADYESYIRQQGKGIFVCDMSDLFGIGVPEKWTSQVLETLSDDCNSMHRFYLLTKQPQNLIKFTFPDNCWVGVTATEQHQYVRALSELRFVEAKVKYLSIEPFLSHIPCLPEALTLAGIGLVIIGAQTNPYKPPKIEWVEEIVQACDKAGIPVFLKDNLEPLLEEAKFTPNHKLYWRDGYYTDITHPEVDLQLRQELPIGHNREAV